MASTYSNIKIQLMATGENSGTWGNVTNVNLGTAIEQAMVETATVTFASANVTLTLTDTNAAQNARALRLNLTGTTGGARDLIVPAIQKPYIVNNGTADTITVKVSGQTGIAVPASKTMLVYNNGTDVVDAINHLSALSLGTALPIASGGTGSTSTTYANLESNVTGTLPVANGGTSATTLTAESVVVGNGTSAVKFVAPGTDGNVLTSNGTSWVSEAPVVPQGVPTGTVSAFAGDPGAGWLECNGQVVSQSTYSDLYAKVGLLVDAFQTRSFSYVGDVEPSAPNGRKMGYGNSTYVIGGEGPSGLPYVATSTDAVSWTRRSVGWISGQTNINSVIYSDKFVATFSTGGTASTNRNNISTSTDGITWTARTTQEIETIYDIAWNGSSTYVITGNQGNNVQTSTDAITWTKRTFAVTVSTPVFLQYGNGIFVSAGYNGAPLRPVIQTSTDGITWTFRSVTNINIPYVNGLWYANGLFWLSGVDSNYGSTSAIYTSTDAITWTQQTTLGRYLNNPKGVAYDSTNSLYHVSGNAISGYAGASSFVSKSIMVTSTDLVDWQLNELGADIQAYSTSGGFSINGARDPQCRTLDYLNNKLIFVGVYGTSRSSNVLAGEVALATSFTSPYTYQTDTQFIVPTAMAGSNGSANQGFKSSLAMNNLSLVNGKGLKYYIKT